jgi:protein-disulfide isomerase
MVRRTVSFLMLILLVAAGAWAQGLSPLEQKEKEVAKAAAPTNALDKGDLEFYVRHLFVWGPQINVEVGEYKESAVPGMLEVDVIGSFEKSAQTKTFFVSKDGQHVLQGASYKIDDNPFRAALDKVDNTGAPAFGTEGASVMITAFSDFQCPYCAKEAKLLRSQLKDEYSDKVRVYFRDFPLTHMHPWALTAAIGGQCIQGQSPEAFWVYHDWVFENQKTFTVENFTAKSVEFMADKGVDVAKLKSCIDSRETLKVVEMSLDEGRAAGVNSTPTVFVNGRKVPTGMQWTQLKSVIDFELEYQKVTHNSGDDCGCAMDITLPGFEN